MRYRQRTCDDTTTSGKVVEETTGGAIGSVDRTYKTLTRHKSVLQGGKDTAKGFTPRFWQKFPYSCRFQLGKKCSTVYTPKVAYITLPVQLFGDDSEPRRLLKVKTSGRDEIACSKEIRQLCSNVKINFSENFVKVSLWV